MDRSPASSALLSVSAEPQLRDTREAFDSVAADYDGPRGNNASIQDMRAEMCAGWMRRLLRAAA